MKSTATQPKENQRYTERTILITTRFPRDLWDKLGSAVPRLKRSAFVVAATARALESEEEEPATVENGAGSLRHRPIE